MSRTPQQVREMEKDSSYELRDLIQRIYQTDTRERALYNLSRKADRFSEIGAVLWRTPGIIPIFLQEIVNGYPLLTAGTQTPKAAINRVSHVLMLLQKVCADDDTRKLVIESEMVPYLLPYLRIDNPLADSLRVYALGVVGMLLRSAERDIVRYLVLQTNIFPLCLESIKMKDDVDKGVGKILATFVLEKLLQHDGLPYVCQVPERCKQVVDALVKGIPPRPVEEQMKKLFRNCIRCFTALSRDEVGKKYLREVLPTSLPFGAQEFNDESLRRVVGELFRAL